MVISHCTSKNQGSDHKKYDMENNLFSNLLTAFIIVAIFAILYCRITNKTLTDLIREIRYGITTQEN